jgi:adenylosuccinate synthase
VLYECEPQYEELPGWNVDISKVNRWEDLPANARAYVERVEELAGVPIRTVSVGPGRIATLDREA